MRLLLSCSLSLLLACGQKAPPIPAAEDSWEQQRTQAHWQAQGEWEIARLEGRLEAEELPPATRAATLLRLGELHLAAAPGGEEPDQSLHAAVDHLRTLHREHSEHPDRDRAHLLMAEALWGLGARDEAVEQAVALVRRYPDSQHTHRAFVLIGDHYYEDSNAYKALIAYVKATRYPDGEHLSYAHYRLAWCYYEVGEYGKAVENMEQTVRLARAARAEVLGGGAEHITLEEQALEDLALFYGEAGWVMEGQEKLVELGAAGRSRELAERTVQRSLDQGRLDLAEVLLRTLVAEDPNHPDAAGHQLRLVELNWEQGDREGWLDDLLLLHQEYGPGSRWARSNADDPVLMRELGEAVERALREGGDRMLHEARRSPKSQAVEPLALAIQLYGLWLEDYPLDSHHVEVVAAMERARSIRQALVSESPR